MIVFFVVVETMYVASNYPNGYITYLLSLTGTLLMPTLSLLSPHTVFSPGEAVRFSCTVLPGHHLNYFDLYKRGIANPLMTQRVTFAQSRVEFTLSNQKTQQGSYSCLYRIKGIPPSSSMLSSPPSNSINITVGESSRACSVRGRWKGFAPMEEEKGIYYSML